MLKTRVTIVSGTSSFAAKAFLDCRQQDIFPEGLLMACLQVHPP